MVATRERPTPEERAARGKAARAIVPRSAQADLASPPPGRDAVGLLESQAATRVPVLVPIRYGRMLTSPFAFYRGAALVQAADLAEGPSSGLVTQLCGDAHLSNFGVYAAPDRRLVFDLNDFDETLPGPFEWDVKRLAGSLAVAGRANGFTPAQRRAVLLETVGRYRAAMRELSGQGNLTVWYARSEVDDVVAGLGDVLAPGDLRRTRKAMAKASTRDSEHAYARLATVIDGRPRIVSAPPLVVPIDEVAEAEAGPGEADRIVTVLRELVEQYSATLPGDRRHLLEQYELVHAARKVVGVGSVGTRAWIALLVGRDHGDPLFLQAKEAQASVLEGFAGPSAHDHAGKRVVVGQRIMQAASDIFLGWSRTVGLDGRSRDFYVRQLRDGKGSVVVERMDPRAMAVYGGLCGTTLARAHARGGDRIAIGAYLGAKDVFDRAVADFAEAYADRTEHDHAALVAAEQAGSITVQHGI